MCVCERERGDRARAVEKCSKPSKNVGTFLDCHTRITCSQSYLFIETHKLANLLLLINKNRSDAGLVIQSVRPKRQRNAYTKF